MTNRNHARKTTDFLTDKWRPLVTAWVRDRAPEVFTMDQAVAGALGGLMPACHKTSNQMRIATLLRDLGYAKTQKWTGGTVRKVWRSTLI